MSLSFPQQLLPRLPQFARNSLGSISSEERPSLAGGWWRNLIADRSFWAVLLICVFGWLSWAIYLERFANSLPFADEYDGFFGTGIATRESPLTWSFLWMPANEHRAPLTRLWSVWLGRLFNWNARPMLQVNLGLLALSSMLLVLAARSVRGRSSLCDSFLPLLVLTSDQFVTLGFYVYAYSMALAVWCMTASAVMAKWQVRSVPHLLLYTLGALVVAWAGGPAGNLWALGLCVPLALGWFERTSVAWKVCAVLSGAAIAASSTLLLYCVPPIPVYHQAFRSESWNMTLRAAAKFSVAWMGQPLLTVIWPWALLALLIPLSYLLVRFLLDVHRLRCGTALVRWSDLGALLVMAFLVPVAMGYGRAKIPGIWDSRYCALVLPIAAVLYLLLVRCDAPKELLNCLTIGMAVCVGWNGPTCIAIKQTMRPRQGDLVRALREGHEPLTVLVQRYSDVVGWPNDRPQDLLGMWQKMRRARLSIFDRETDAARQCLFVSADSASLPSSLSLVDDGRAVRKRAVEARVDGATATSVYEITVPTPGVYKLCCRWLVPGTNQSFAMAIDDSPTIRQSVPGGPNYSPSMLTVPLSLEAGTHRLKITWPGAGARLDVFELTPA